MIKTIKDLSIKGKTVIIRCDFNVPIKDSIIQDDNRIKESLETINYAISKKAKVILMSHLGRVETEEDKHDNSLRVVSERLSELLKKPVYFADITRGEELEYKINLLALGDVLLMENTRFEDIDGKKESKNNPELGAYWASLGDYFVNDAFGTSHRAHASNVGIATHLESAVGFLIEKELKFLENAINKPKRPLTVILGGSKVVDKIGVINNLVNVADYILIGGGMSYTFLKAQGYEIGNSLLDESSIEFCKDILAKHSDKIILPIDSICTDKLEEDSLGFYAKAMDMPKDMMGVDIGEQTIELFKEYLEKSKTIIWNGPVGVFEIETFAKGTKDLLDMITDLDAITIIGGGDTASAAINFGYKDKITHISTGGGASLELLEGKILPGIDVIK
jgi:phosphoglycerate kinase